MRGLLQRVSSAEVLVGGAVVGSIGRGILAFIGIAEGDTPEDVAWLTKKIATVRLFDDWKTSCASSSSPSSVSSSAAASPGAAAGRPLQVLLVSQFTLHATLRKPKPSFSHAMPAERARVLFEALVAAMRAELPGEGRVATGAFREMMEVRLVNDGPVTVSVDSWNRDGGLLPSPPPRMPLAGAAVAAFDNEAVEGGGGGVEGEGGIAGGAAAAASGAGAGEGLGWRNGRKGSGEE